MGSPMVKIFLTMLLFAPEISQGQDGMTTIPAGTLTEAGRIEYLIKSIESLNGAAFWRNGIWYDAKTAGSHLRMKLEKAGKRIGTAEDFIKYIGTGSSVSGKPYRIRFSDGSEIETSIFFTEKLNELKKRGTKAD
jgi:hypothetical protein